MATTTNYGWEIPDDTDLVKDGAASIRELGQDIDTTVFGLPTGSMTLISTTTFSTATITLGSIPQTYNDLYLVVRNFVPSVDNEGYYLRVNSDATASRHFSTSTLVATNQAFNATSWSNFQGFDNVVSEHTAVIHIYDYTNTTTWKQGHWAQWANAQTTTTNIDYQIAYGLYNQTSAVTSLQFIAPTGTFTSGTVLLYGVK